MNGITKHELDELVEALAPMVSLAHAYTGLLTLHRPDAIYDPNGMIPRAEAAIERLRGAAAECPACGAYMRPVVRCVNPECASTDTEPAS